MAAGFNILFQHAQDGDRAARDALYRFAFSRLRSIASALLRRERPGHTLQPTALVGELFLKIHRLGARILDEDHFFRVSARAMRQVLIDYARKRAPESALDAGSMTESLSAACRGGTDLESLLGVRMLFEKFEQLDPLAANTVWLHAVEGLTFAELSEAQGREPWRVRADFDFGTRWMADKMARQVRPKADANSADQARTSAGRR